MTKKYPFIALLLLLFFLLTTSSCSKYYKDVYTEGEEIYYWNLGDIYKDQDSWYADHDKLQSMLGKISRYENQLNSLNNFKSAIYLQEDIIKLLDKLTTYALLYYHQDTTNPSALDMKSKADNLVSQASESLSYIEAEIRTISDNTLVRYLNIPEMSIYNDYVSDIKDPTYKHLTKDEEKLLSLASSLYSIPQDLYETYIYHFNYPKDKFNSEDLYSKDRVLRQEAMTKYYDKRVKGIHLLSETLASQVAVTTFIARAKGFSSPLEAAMYRNKLATKDYDNLISITHNNLNALHKWMAIRRDSLGFNDEPLKIYDLHMNILPTKPNTLITYDKARELIENSISPLGNDYLKGISSAFDDGWIFPIPKDNKYKGAYTTNIYDLHPFVLVNYYGTIDSLMTLSHELGHAMHFQFTNDNQPYTYSKLSVYTAEVASTTNEILLLEYLLSQATSDEEKLILLYEYIQLIANTLYNQVLGAEFEKSIYDAYMNKEHLDAEYFNSTWANLQQTYYGDAFESEMISSTTWAEIPHFYNSFYVYQYATGITAGLYFGQEISKGNEQAIDKYLEFLSAGSSDEALALLNKAGIDMKSQEPYHIVFKKFDQLVKEFDKLYKAYNN